MKKLRIIMAVVLLFNMFSSITLAQNLENNGEIIDKFLEYNETSLFEDSDISEEQSEQKFYCTATAEDNFETSK